MNNMKNNIDRYIDYKVGDWVETCHIMPGKVQSINKSEDTVEIYYPHYKKKYSDYTGGSCCSICHCGVHKINSKLANAFLKVGEERVTRVYNFLQRNVHIKGIEKSIQRWKEYFEQWKNMPIDEQQKRYYWFKYNRTSTYWYTSIPQTIHSYQEYYKYELEWHQNILKEYEDKLYEAWQEFNKLYHQTVMDLANNVINNTTKGIWLSYQKHTLERKENGIRIIQLCKTGEQFLVKKRRKKYIFLKKIN